MGLGIASLVVAPFTSFIPFAVPALLSPEALFFGLGIGFIAMAVWRYATKEW